MTTRPKKFGEKTMNQQKKSLSIYQHLFFPVLLEYDGNQKANGF